MEIKPFFKSHYSIGKSILTLDDPEKDDRSIFHICKKNNIKQAFLVEDAPHGLMEAMFNSKKFGVDLILGLRFVVTENIKVKNEESLSSEHKVIILFDERAKSNIYKLYSKAATDGFYYLPRIDFNLINEFWCEGMYLVIPFYDSFIFNNSLRLNNSVPDFSKIKASFAIEDNGLCFDSLVSKRVKKYCEENNFEYFNAQSIYYENREDFLAYLTLKCIQKRSELEKPQMEHMSSSEFCMESFVEKLKL